MNCSMNRRSFLYLRRRLSLKRSIFPCNLARSRGEYIRSYISSPNPSIPPFTNLLRLKHEYKPSLSSSILPELEICWSLVGNPKGPVIFIAPSMSHSANVTRPAQERINSDKLHNQYDQNEEKEHEVAGEKKKPLNKGWWEDVVGWGDEFGVNLNIFQVLSASPLGAPYGTTSALSINPHTKTPYRASFPVITPLDQANIHAILIQQVKLQLSDANSSPNPFSDRLYAIIGSSMGGMSVFHLSTQYPTLSHRYCVIATTARTSPSTQALRSVQRDVVRMDVAYQDGNYNDNERPYHGMSIARKMGTICYRSRAEFDSRFINKFQSKQRDPQLHNNMGYIKSSIPPGQNKNSLINSKTTSLVSNSSNILEFEVERYLSHVSGGFGVRYDANCYLTLSLCMDLQDISQSSDSFVSACEKIDKTSEWMILPVSQDELIPAAELDFFASTIGEMGVSVHHERIDSLYGHDAFLKEGSKLNPRISEFLTRGDLSFSGVENVRRFVNELTNQ